MSNNRSILHNVSGLIPYIFFFSLSVNVLSYAAPACCSAAFVYVSLPLSGCLCSASLPICLNSKDCGRHGRGMLGSP